MGLNRMMFVKRPAGSSGGDEPANMFVMTMGQVRNMVTAVIMLRLARWKAV